MRADWRHLHMYSRVQKGILRICNSVGIRLRCLPLLFCCLPLLLFCCLPMLLVPSLCLLLLLLPSLCLLLLLLVPLLLLTVIVSGGVYGRVRLQVDCGLWFARPPALPLFAAVLRAISPAPPHAHVPSSASPPPRPSPWSSVPMSQANSLGTLRIT